MVKINKQKWKRRLNSIQLPDGEDKLLTAFNASVDEVVRVGEQEFRDLIQDLDTEKIQQRLDETPENVNSLEDFVAIFLESVEMDEGNGANLEDGNIREEIMEYFEVDTSEIGGQAGTAANFLSHLSETILYTPQISREQSSYIKTDVLYPVVDDGLDLKKARDIENSQTTRRNIIFEYGRDFGNEQLGVEAKSPGRFVLSDPMESYTPYLPEDIEENIGELMEGVDRVFLSGYHSIGENYKEVLEKSREQIEKMKKSNEGTKIHLEFVAERDPDLEEGIIEHIAKTVHSVGCDSSELREIMDILDLGSKRRSSSKLGNIVLSLNTLMKQLDLQRFHIHTKNFLCVATDQNYGVRPEKIRESLLFGGYAAVAKTISGEIPDRKGLKEGYRFHFSEEGLEEMKNLKKSLNLDEDFPGNGISKLNGLNIIVVPAMIAEEHERMIGLGDIISSGSFLYEVA